MSQNGVSEKVRVGGAKKPRGHAASRPSTRVAADSPVAPTPAARNAYLVRGGDTLYRIALKHGTTVALLMAANSLVSPQAIHPGDRLTIPVRNP